MDETPPPLRRALPRKSAGTAALLGWVLPGLGQAYVGRPGKAFFFFVVILGTFAFGLWAADWRAVSEERQPVWFCAQALAAVPTALATWLTRSLEMDRAVPLLDVGLLYTSVAGLLNAVAVADAIGTVQEIAEAADAEAAMMEEEVEAPPFASGEVEDAAAGLPPFEPATEPLAEPLPSPGSPPAPDDAVGPSANSGDAPPSDGTAP